MTPGSAARRGWPFVVLFALLLAPAWAAWRMSGPRTLTLDLGPGDGPYVTGFTPEWEVGGGVGTHWTTYQAAVALPIEVRGPVNLTLRYARVLPQTAVVDVTVSGREAGRFTCRGGAWEERAFAADAGAASPATVALSVDSHDRRNLGLKLDWLRLEAGGARLAGSARARPLATVALLVLLGLALGWPIAHSAAGAAPAAAGLTALLLRDAWLVHRLLAGVPEMLGAAVLGVLALRTLPRFRAGLAPAMRLAGALAAYAFVLRAGVVNHPSFYYPDLLVHARLVEVVREAGPDFLRAPSTYLWGGPGSVGASGRGPSGLWLKDVGGRAYGLPYSLAFHAPFAPIEATLDRRIAWLKVWGAALSIVPVLALAALARRWGLSFAGVVLLLFVPTYVSRLTLALLPALFGHAAEMLLLVWLARRPAGRLTTRDVTAGALLLAACQLAYVSAHASLMVAGLAAGALVSGAPDARARARGLLAMFVAASVLSLALYYRDFLGPWLPGGGGIAGVRGAGSGSGFENPLRRLQAVFGTTFVVAAAAAAPLLWRSPARAILAAWAGVGAVLLAARSVVPVMRFAHEELWLAPLVCLAAGQGVAWLWSGGRGRRVAAVVAALALAAEGTLLQWRALAAQLHPLG